MEKKIISNYIFLCTFASVLLNKLIKKGGGIGPMKPWQPTIIADSSVSIGKPVPNPILALRQGKISVCSVNSLNKYLK